MILGTLLSACGAAAVYEPTQETYSTPEYENLKSFPTATMSAFTDEEWGPTYGGTDPVNDEPYYDVFFENYGVNPFIDTEDENLSTFALDVDTGSYTVARRYLFDGYIPDKDSVRVEEYVNYFDMGYALPDDNGFNLHLEGGPTPFGISGRYRVIRIGVQGYDVPDEERKPAVLTFVIDISGSMDMENRLEAVKSSLLAMVNSLRPTDQVGIVVYGSMARTVLRPTPVNEMGTVKRAIRGLSPGGSTNAEAGLLMAYKLASRAYEPGSINRVILCSDGVANVGATGPDSILEEIRKYADQDIQLTTVGFGMGNYNDVLMERLADDGDGFYAYVDNKREAERLFVHDLTGTLQTIAMDAKIQVEFNPDMVTRFRLIGFENRALENDEFRDDTVDAGEIGAGHSVTALYAVKLTEDAEEKPGQALANVYMRWEDPDWSEITEIEEVMLMGDLADSFEQTSDTFQLAVLVAEFAEILRESYWAKEYSLKDVEWELEQLSGGLLENEDVEDFVYLVREAVDLRRE